MSAKGAVAKRKATKKSAGKKMSASPKKMPAKKKAVAAKRKTQLKPAPKRPPAAAKPTRKKKKAPRPKITKNKTAAKKKKTAAKTTPTPTKRPALVKKAAPKKAPKPPKAEPKKAVTEPIKAPVVAKEEPVKEPVSAPVKKPGVLRVARGERRPTRAKKGPDPVEQARAALAKVGAPESRENGQMKSPARIVEINPRLESSRDKIEKRPDLPNKPPSVAERKRQEAEAAFQKIAPQHNEITQHFHKTPFDVRISERDSLATQVRMSGSVEEALRAARELAERYRLPPDQVTLVRIVELGDERLTKLALEELLELDDKGRVRPTSDLITTVTAIRSKDEETIELKDLLLEKVGAR